MLKCVLTNTGIKSYYILTGLTKPSNQHSKDQAVQQLFKAIFNMPVIRLFLGEVQTGDLT